MLWATTHRVDFGSMSLEGGNGLFEYLYPGFKRHWLVWISAPKVDLLSGSVKRLKIGTVTAAGEDLCNRSAGKIHPTAQDGFPYLLQFS